MDKLCATCGKPLQPDQAFCDNCGAAWTPAVAPVAAAQARKSAAGGILLLVAIAVVALGAGGWFFLRHGPAAAVAAPIVSSSTPPAIASTTEAAASSKPCSLLTQAEMETILGAKIVKVTTNELSCSYFTDETMSAQIETKWSGGREAIAEAKGFNSGPGLFEPVAGIGDEAYMQAAGVLHVLKGDTYVVVNSREYPSDSGGGHLEMESAIARKALEKLK